MANDDTHQEIRNRGAGEQADNDYRMWFRSCAEGVLIIDPETKIVRYANPAAVRILGYAEQQLSTMRVSELFPAEAPRHLTELEAVTDGQGPRAADVVGRCKDGRVFSAELTTASITLEARPMILSFFRDVTERQQAQLALAASELRYRRLFETAKDGILILDAESGEIEDVNPFMCSLMGCLREDLLGKHLWEIGPLKDIAASKAAFDELQARGYVRYDHLPLESYDGRKIDVEFVSNVYPVDGHAVIQCNIRDITERIRSLAALRILERAIQAASQGIVIADLQGPDHPLVYASPGFERMTGYLSAEIIGKDCRFLQGPRTDPATTAEIREALAEPRACTVELLNYRKDGTPFWNHLSLSPVCDAQGQATNFVGVLTDVTDRRQLEAQFLQAQKMDAVGRLAGGVAHDFNNALSVILSYAEIIAADLQPEDPMCADIQEISKAGLRASELTRQLLVFSRLQVVEGKVLDLHQAITGMRKMLDRLLGADIEVTILPTSDLWSIKADLGQVEQVLMNLAVNARDAMPLGGEWTIELRNVELNQSYVRAHHDVRPGPHVMLKVTDNGIGMDEATQGRALEPFFTTKEPGRGTGLGLAAVFGIVKQSGGHLWINSELGRGTTINLYFPRVTSVAEVALAAAPISELPRPTETILLVEDDEQVRALTQNILRRCGYVVLAASNSGEALLICEEHQSKIDLMLTDVVMPRMSGRQLAERLAPLRPEMKVLFMSGYTNDEVLRRGVQDGEKAYLQKPITPTTLAKKVRDLLPSQRGAADG